jgi:hypothetical protein
MPSNALEPLTLSDLSIVAGGASRRDWRTVGALTGAGATVGVVTGATIGAGIGLVGGGILIPLTAGAGALSGAVTGGLGGFLVGIQSTNY